MNAKNILAFCVTAFLIGAIIAGYFGDNVEIPDYVSFGECRTGDKEIVTVRICFDGQSGHARNVIFEFRNRATRDPVFLIWNDVYRDEEMVDISGDIPMHNAKVVVTRLYWFGWGRWQLAETKILDQALLPGNKPIPYFDADSTFGREYFKYFLDRGKKFEEIVIPTITFGSQKF